jgi:hypothetical protein
MGPVEEDKKRRAYNENFLKKEKRERKGEKNGKVSFSSY